MKDMSWRSAKKEEGGGLCYYLFTRVFPPFLDLTQASLALFVVLFLHSCRSQQLFVILLNSWSSCDLK